MSVEVVLFTRDLRVHDHPALSAAVASAGEVVPLFVFDDAILAGVHAAPNRVQFLLDALHDLRAALRARGGDLVLRRGDVAVEVGRVVEATGARAVHVTDDVSAYAARRRRRLADVARAHRAELHRHPGHVLVEPGLVAPSGGGDHFRVFTPYWRRWTEVAHRTPLAAPARVRVPSAVAAGAVPVRAELVRGAVSPDLPRGGERTGRARVDAWLDGLVDGYETRRDVLADPDGSSRLSPHLHLGTVSVAELASRLDRRRRGHVPFLRQLCWRDFHHQLLAADPDLPRRDHRPRGDHWRDDDEALAAWRDGRTGYPLVDAGMRQLRREGWMPNRARMVTASFLTKHLYVDWRRGAAHFACWLVDGDLASNWGQWQWVAGTGADTRPNRMFNPVAQSRRHDPDGDYLRCELPELADLDGRSIHAPWTVPGGLDGRDYPPPIVDHAAARARFLSARAAM